MKHDNNNVIVTIDEARDDQEEIFPYDPTKADIDIREIPLSIFDLIRKYNDGRLFINSDFPHNLTWDLEQKSRFIESVILNYPLPSFFVQETREGKYMIVDGMQRVMALDEFVCNEFELTGLNALTHLNGECFSTLKAMFGAYQTKIEDKKVYLYVLRPSLPRKVICDLLSRINQRQSI